MFTRRTLRLGTTAAAVLLAAALIAPSAMAQDDTTVTAAFLEAVPNTLDPQAAQNVDEFQVLYNICEGLMKYEPTTLEPVAGLAESYTISDDGLVYTFMLRDGVTFQNGRAMTADDVVYSFTRLANPNTGVSYTAGLILSNVVGFSDMRAEGSTVTELAGVEALDASTIQITLNSPATAFLNQLTLPGGMIVAEESATDEETFAEAPVCTGPYSVSEFDRQNQVTLSAYDGYWGGAPAVKTGILRVIPEASQQVLEFEGGNLDITFVPEPDLQRLRDDATFSEQLQVVPLLNIFHLRLNLSDPALSDPNVRLALSLAIDRQTIIDTVLAGQGTPAHGVYPPGLSTYDAEYNPFPYDPERARQLLTDAGYPDGLTLEARTGQVETEVRVLGAIQQQVAEAGITFNVNSTERSVWDQDRGACNMQMGTISWGMDYPDPENVALLLTAGTATSGSRFNCGYGSYEGAEEIQAELVAGGSMPLGEERNQFYRDIERQAMDIAVLIPLYHGTRTALVAPGIGGTPIDSNSIIRFDLITMQ